MKTAEDMTVYRGSTESRFCKKNLDYGFEVIENAQTGETITPDLGYSYTSPVESTTKNWGNNAGMTDLDGTPLKGMMMKIKIPSGAKVSKLIDGGRSEVLMPRGAQYKLISKELDSDNVWQAALEYILPDS